MKRKERRKQTRKDFSARPTKLILAWRVAFFVSNVSKNNKLAIEFFQ